MSDFAGFTMGCLSLGLSVAKPQPLGFWCTFICAIMVAVIAVNKKGKRLK